MNKVNLTIKDYITLIDFLYSNYLVMHEIKTNKFDLCITDKIKNKYNIEYAFFEFDNDIVTGEDVVTLKMGFGYDVIFGQVEHYDNSVHKMIYDTLLYYYNFKK